MNATTTVTLNDRFSSFKSSNGGSAPRPRSRARSSSRSRQPRGRPQQVARLGGSTRNRQLLDKMEKQHKMRLALKLKNKSIVRSRGRPQAQIIRNNVRRATNIMKTVNMRNLQRNNNLTTFVPLNDGPRRNMRGRSRSRSRSQSRARSQSLGRQQAVSITDRLGVRQPRGRMRRANNGGANQQQQQTSRSRPRSRVRLNRNNFPNNRNAPNQAHPNRRSNSVNARRSNSVNARLGNSATKPNLARRRARSNVRNQNSQLNRPLTGRIVKRKAAGVRAQRGNQNVRKNGAALAVNARRGRVVKRGGGGNLRGQARGRANNRGNQSAAQGPPARRGRSRTRRGVNNNRGIFRLKLEVDSFKDLCWR